MVKQTVTGTISGMVTGTITLEIDVPIDPPPTPPPGPEPPANHTWRSAIVGTTSPALGLDGPGLSLAAQQRAYDLPESLQGLPERTDLQAQLDAADRVCQLEPGIYRQSATVSKTLEIRGGQRVSIRASDDWSPGGSAGNQWSGNASQGWTSSLQVPNWDLENLADWQAPDAWRASRPWVVMVGGVRFFVEPGTGKPSDGHFRLNNRRVILPVDPRSASIEVTTRGGPAWLNIQAADVILDGIDFRHAPSGLARWNALESNTNRTHHLNCMFSWVHGGGPGPGSSTGSIFENCIFANCGVVGLAGWQMHQSQLRNNLFFNNGYGEGWDPLNANGGAKLVSCNGVVWENNVAWHNGMSGLWLDIDGRDNTFTGNVAFDNAHSQIHYEISQQGEIAGNVCFRTPRTLKPNERTIGVYCSSSRQVRINNNLSMNLPSCFEFRGQPRDDVPGDFTGWVHEGNTAIGRSRPPDQAQQWGNDFLLVWVGPGAMNNPSNVARNNRYGAATPEANNEPRWAYWDNGDVWLWQLADLQQRTGGTMNIGSGASYIGDGERQELLKKFGLS